MTLVIKAGSVEERKLELNQKLNQLQKQLSVLLTEKDVHSPWIDVQIVDVKIRQLCWLVDSDSNADTYSLLRRLPSGAPTALSSVSNGVEIDPVQLHFKSVRELKIDWIRISPETGWMLIKSESKPDYPQLEDARKRRSKIFRAIAQINKEIKLVRAEIKEELS